MSLQYPQDTTKQSLIQPVLGRRVQRDLKKGGSYHCIKIFNKDIDNKKRAHHVLEEKLMQQS